MSELKCTKNQERPFIDENSHCGNAVCESSILYRPPEDLPRNYSIGISVIVRDREQTELPPVLSNKYIRRNEILPECQNLILDFFFQVYQNKLQELLPNNLLKNLVLKIIPQIFFKIS